MRIVAADYILTFLDGDNRARHEQKRAPGLHVSDVIRDLANRTKYKNKRVTFDKLEGDQLEYAQKMTDFGFMLESALNHSHARIPRVISNEEAIELAWKRRMCIRRADEMPPGDVIRPGEIILDGMAMNPDGARCDIERGEEYKATWRSMSKVARFADEFTEWCWQMACYGKGMGLREFDLFVYWVNGDYRPPGGYRPITKVYTVSYLQDEIDQKWDMIRRHRDLMLKEMEAA